MLRFVLIIGLLGGCPVDNPPINYPTQVTVDMSRLTLGIGDKINLTVFYSSKSLNAAYTLDDSGSISVQFIGVVKADGRTLREVEKEIQDRLADGYLQEPIVSVNLIELNSKFVSVSGMVGKTGKVRYTKDLSITDAISQSGGFTPLARKNMVRVTRFTNGTQQTYKVPVERISEGTRPNFPMLPGDDVFVPERPW